MEQTKVASHSFPFLSSGLSVAMPLWLLFRQSLEHDGWALNAQNLFARQGSASDAELIQYWLSGQPNYELMQGHTGWMLLVIGAIFGFLSMLGGLNYSGSEPVNLWLLLGVYCFMPLLLCITTCYAWFSRINNVVNSIGKSTSVIPGGYAWAKRFFAPLLKILSFPNGQTLAQNSMLKAWFMWKLQGAALAFQLSATVTFVLVLVFKDVAFGWSSTIIHNDAWIPVFIESLAWPWSWLMSLPSAELITESRFYRGQNVFDAVMLGQWWSYVFMAMIVYGLLPRLLLVGWMKYQVKAWLVDDISSSGDVERFIRAVRHVDMTSKNTGLENIQQQDMPQIFNDIDASQYIIVAWQYESKQMNIEATLGKKSWDSDTKWIYAAAPAWRKPIAIVVALDQTPTAELADIIMLMREQNTNTSISINICTPSAIENKRELGQLTSWQYFASVNHLDLRIIKISRI